MFFIIKTNVNKRIKRNGNMYVEKQTNKKLTSFQMKDADQKKNRTKKVNFI